MPPPSRIAPDLKTSRGHKPQATPRILGRNQRPYGFPGFITIIVTRRTRSAKTHLLHRRRARCYPFPMHLRDLVKSLDAIAPTRYAESWDNVGLLVGDPDQP